MARRHPVRDERRGLIVHVDVERGATDVAVDPDVTDVLVIVHHGDAVIGQQWLRPGGARVLRAEDLWNVVVKGYAPVIEFERARRLAQRALGAPAQLEASTPVAVVVCTKDRPEQLRTCLQSLLKLNRSIELLVVDNASTTDQTARTCAELGVRCVSEPRPGQAYARNRGFAETSAPFVAFTDDDVTASPDWLDGLDQAFDDPQTMIATGYVGPVELEHHDQVQFEAHGAFERHPFPKIFSASDQATMTAAGLCGAGANMVIRRELLTLIGAFDVDFGPGSPVRTADDKLFFYRTLEAGYRIRYTPSQKVWHQHRADRASLLRIMRDYGVGEFTWTAHVLRTRRDLTALRVWRWWAGHYLRDVKRNLTGQQSGVDLSMTIAELRGIADAPGALRAISRLRNAGRGGPPPQPTDPALAHEPAPEPATPQASVTAELPSMTVAIPSHQRRDALRSVLERLAEQTLPSERVEVLVALDGCTDGSAEMVRGLDLPIDVQITELSHAGVSNARNTLIAQASNAVVVFLDDDIEPAADCLAAFGRAHAAAAEPTWVFGPCPPVLGNSWIEQGLSSWWGDHYRHKAAAGHQWSVSDFGIGNSAAPRSALRELGGFDPAFKRRREDYELGFRYLSGGGRCSFAPAAYAHHYATAGVGTMLSNAFGEGEHDVTFATLHPAAGRQLPLGIGAIRDLTLTRRDRIAARLSDEQWTRIADRLEAAGQRGRWKQLTTGLWLARYRAGLRAGLTEHGLDSLPALPDGERIRVPLDHSPLTAAPLAGLALPIGGIGGTDLVFEIENRPVATVPAIIPGSQWAWDDVVARAADALTDAIALSGLRP